jgi:hypothetical protein
MEFREILKMFDFDPKPPADEDRDDEVLESAAQIKNR